MSLCKDASCQNASRAGAALLPEGRQPGAGSDLAGRGALLGFWRRPPLRLFLGCFFPAALVSCVALSRGGWAPWGSELCCAKLCSAVVVYPSECCTFHIWCSLGRQEKNANTENIQQSLQSVGSDSLFPSPCCWSTQSALEWKALCLSWIWCLFFPLPFGWCIVEVALYEIGFRRNFVNLGQMSLGVLTVIVLGASLV